MDNQLEAQLATLKKREAELNSEIRKHRKQAKVATGAHHVAQVLHKAGVDEATPSLPTHAQKKLLFLMEVSDCCTDVATSWVLGQGRQTKCRGHGLGVWDGDARRNISASIDLLYLGVPFESVSRSLEGEVCQMKVLCKYAIEYKLYHWLVELNCSKGVAPGISQLLVQACRYIPEKTPETVRDRLKAFFTSGDRGTRYWVSSFRKRWGVTPGLLRAGEDLEPGQCESKDA